MTQTPLGSHYLRKSQASVLGYTRPVLSKLVFAMALSIHVLADELVERKSSSNLISYAHIRLNLVNKIHAEKRYLPMNLYSAGSRPVTQTLKGQLPFGWLIQSTRRVLIG